MIPLKLIVSGFLSYRHPVEIDFTGFDLACISGPNGAGKSSLLDAITWVLFGQARKRDDSLINSHSQIAEVSLVFTYENNVYRVQRLLPRGKTTQLEFHLASHYQHENNMEVDEMGGVETNITAWKALTERTMRETQARIEQILRLDYDTFVNASFFLQGKADQFTQQSPGDRKRILSSILGLEIWETYRLRASEERKTVELEINSLDRFMQEIAAELAEEPKRLASLNELGESLLRISQVRQAQEAALENLQRSVAIMAEQEKQVEAMARQVDVAGKRLEELRGTLEARQSERETFLHVVERADEIETAHQRWLKARQELERWETLAVQFWAVDKRRQAPIEEINAARGRLEQEKQALSEQKAIVEKSQDDIAQEQHRLELSLNTIHEMEARLANRETLENQLQSARQTYAEAGAEKPRLEKELKGLKERIEQLSQAEGAKCPLCGQALSPAERQHLLETLKIERTALVERQRTNQVAFQYSGDTVRTLESEINALTRLEADMRGQQQKLEQVNYRLASLHAQQADWEQRGKPRLQEVEQMLQEGTYAPQARIHLMEIDVELRQIGYDPSAHEASRQEEMSYRGTEEELRLLETARATLAPLKREITNLEKQMETNQVELGRLQADYNQAAEALASAQALAPDLNKVERELMELRGRENQLRLELGAAQQKVKVLEDLKVRLAVLENQRDTRAALAGQYKQLERAFGKDGVPALLIEQALPQIEVEANEILERLSGGAMSVRFITQAAYKDRQRGDLRETLDIQISDGIATRDYELYSGGEAFRVNFAIRLALSEVLAQRAGARLQTLVIDEGFGSQDAEGRQRLVEAINQVRQDFAKILVITHIDELKDAFPTRIEVEKTSQGSVVRVM